MMNNFAKNAAFQSAGGEYEYDINLPNQGTKISSNIGDSVSNPNSVTGHYADIGKSGNNGSQININSNYNGLVGNINVKKSMIKLGNAPGGGTGDRVTNDIRDRDMDMSPKSSKNEINFHNQN